MAIGEIPLDQMRAWQQIAWYRRDTYFYPQHPKLAFNIGVYAIWHQARLLYIGYSKNVRARGRQHFLTWGLKSSDARLTPTLITSLKMPTEQEAAALEAALILHHKPRFNRKREPVGGHVRGQFGSRHYEQSVTNRD